MEKKIQLPEKLLYEIWKEQNFITELSNEHHEKIGIINRGEDNSCNEGPDFINAKIKIGNLIYHGDIEIDLNYSDWKTHGHNFNKKFNKVILHVYLNCQYHLPYVYTQEGRKVPSICIKDFIQDDLRTSIQKTLTSHKSNHNIKMPCFEANDRVYEKDKLDFLYKLGIVRFKSKCNKIYERLKEISYLKANHIKEPVIGYEFDEQFFNKEFRPKDFENPDIWHQIIYELIFEALGYSKNKEIMLRLAKSVEIDFYKKLIYDEHSVQRIESALFYISGLINHDTTAEDDQTSAYLRRMAEYWKEVKYIYDGHMFKEVDWKFAKLRPSNFPTIRLSGGARIIHRLLKENLVGKIIAEINKTDDLRKSAHNLRDLLIVKGEGYWGSHYNFNLKIKEPFHYLVGASRIDEIIINVILPLTAVYFEMFNKTELFQKVLRIYADYYQNTENTLVNDVSSTLQLQNAWKRSILYQGMIELFRSYCSKNKCPECSIGVAAFDE